MLLKGKTALITGTNRGIGKTILIEFAKNGANVFAHARKESTDFIQMVEDVASQYNVKIYPVYFDVTDTDSLKANLRKVIQTKIPLDILVNSAGVAHGGLFQMTPVSKIKEVFDVNFFSYLEVTQALSRVMLKQGSGSIINIASIAGIDLRVGNCAYGASKAAVIAFTKTLASEYGKFGLRVNAVAPGLIDTEMASLMEEKAGYEMIQSSAMKRLGRPEEIAKVVLFLASDESSFVNGQILRVDGGIA